MSSHGYRRSRRYRNNRHLDPRHRSLKKVLPARRVYQQSDEGDRDHRAGDGSYHQCALPFDRGAQGARFRWQCRLRHRKRWRRGHYRRRRRREIRRGGQIHRGRRRLRLAFPLLLLQRRAVSDQVLLDIAHRQLHVEIAGMLPRNLIQSVEDRFERFQVGNQIDLPVQVLHFIERIQILDTQSK